MTDSGRLTGSREPSQSSLSRPVGFDPGRSIADKLAEARALIERGWNRYDFTSDPRGIRHQVVNGPLDGTSLCAMGAVGVVCGEMPYGEPAPTVEIASRYLGEAVGIEDATPDDIGCWNMRQRAKKPVLAAFDKAIELAREQVSA